MRFYRRLLHQIDNYGMGGALLRALRKFAGRPDPGPPFLETQEPHPFDQLYSTDTSGHIPGEKLAGRSPSDLYNTAYYAISPSTLTHALELFPEPLTGFTFVDLGCGKGRALLIAAQFPFAQILGVELSPDLCAIASANIWSHPRINTVVIVQQGDAATMIYPDAPLLIYLYHPFLAPVLHDVLANIEGQRHGSSHPTYLLYANCRYEKVMARFRFLKVVWDYSLPLSPEDAAADRHRITHERFTLYRAHF